MEINTFISLIIKSCYFLFLLTRKIELYKLSLLLFGNI